MMHVVASRLFGIQGRDYQFFPNFCSVRVAHRANWFYWLIEAILFELDSLGAKTPIV